MFQLYFILLMQLLKEATKGMELLEKRVDFIEEEHLRHKREHLNGKRKLAEKGIV